MTRNHNTADNGVEPENSALRSELRTRADLITIAPPPIPAVRRNARKRRTRRRLLRGVSGLAVTCVVVAGVVVLSPGQDVGVSPAPMITNGSSPTPLTTPKPAAPTTTTANYLSASDLGAGWTRSDTPLAPRAELLVAGSQCDGYSDYKAQVPVTPAPNKLYQYAASGKPANQLFEAVYTFAPGTGPTVIANVRAALETSCGQPRFIKLLASPQTVADEAIVYTAGGDFRNVLVRSGDRVASMIVGSVPASQEGTAWIEKVARQMAIRLTTG